MPLLWLGAFSIFKEDNLKKDAIMKQGLELKEALDLLKRKALDMGFGFVVSSPLTRSSFEAEEGYRACRHRMLQASHV